MDTVTEAAMAI
jgi:IMP dehydrogenase